MSNPSRQMNSRRLPPLPNVAGRRGVSPHPHPHPGAVITGGGGRQLPHRHGMASPSYSKPRQDKFTPPPDMIVKGQPLNNSGTFTKSSFLSSHIVYDRGSNQDLHPDLVSHYLNENPEFLDHYVATSVGLDRVDKWAYRKRQQKQASKNSMEDMISTNGNISPRDSDESDLFHTKLYIQKDGRKTLSALARELHQLADKTQILYNLAQCVAQSTNADGFNLYLVDDNGEELHFVEPQTDGKSIKLSATEKWKAGPGSTLAALAVHQKQCIRIADVVADERTPQGIGVGGRAAESAIAHPIIQREGKVVGVVELYRHSGNGAFTADDEEIGASYLTWGQVAVSFSEMYLDMSKQRKLNDFLLAVTKSIFQDIVSMDTVIMKIMNFAQKLVHADRASLFLLDFHNKELFARIFDVGSGAEGSQTEIRFPMDKGVAGFVASTGQILNIQDAYADDRFNREVDLQTGYKTNTILCMPIYIRGNIMGVVQMVNKISGIFTKEDEGSFETFAIYCGLALHHAKLYDKIRRSEQKYKVALEVLSYHSQAQDDELSTLKEKPIPENLPELIRYDFSPWDVSTENKPLHVIYMFKDLFSMTSLKDEENNNRFDTMALYKFTLTVKKNYRNVPYHNWAHAFSVAHAMYTVIKTTKNVFSPLECLALFVACICHDLDHRGKTNSFMVQSESPLSAMYSTSTMEHHHFNQTVAILQNDGHNIFRHLTSEEYKQVLGDIKHSILATDLALFFGNKARLKGLVDKGKFSWEEKEHRIMLMATCMTACDLCSMYKPWDLQVNLVQDLMEEFWQQGDEEKQKGNTPIPMMDRQKADQLPSSQVGFLVGICLPCYELLAEILPDTKPMVQGAQANLQKWKELADSQKNEDETKSQPESAKPCTDTERDHKCHKHDTDGPS